jgi:hypothetical protein
MWNILCFQSFLWLFCRRDMFWDQILSLECSLGISTFRVFSLPTLKRPMYIPVDSLTAHWSWVCKGICTKIKSTISGTLPHFVRCPPRVMACVLPHLWIPCRSPSEYPIVGWGSFVRVLKCFRSTLLLDCWASWELWNASELHFPWTRGFFLSFDSFIGRPFLGYPLKLRNSLWISEVIW